MENRKKENRPPSSPSQVTEPARGTASTKKRGNETALSLRSSQATGNPTSGASSSSRLYPRHITMPFEYGKSGRVPRGEDLERLKQVFPSALSVHFGPGYIEFIFRTLPPGPYPLTIAGAICLVRDIHSPASGAAALHTRGAPGSGGVKLLPEFNAVNMAFTPSSLRGLFDSVFAALRGYLPALDVREISIKAGKILNVVVGNNVDLVAIRDQKPLPSWIANLWTEYLYEREVPRPEELAQRATKPDGRRGVVDDEPYSILRPGVLVNSRANAEQTLTTTSGVLVKDEQDHEFMTAASHGVGPDETLFQRLPLDETRIVGRAALEISFTDIALIKLAADREFTNELFEEPGSGERGRQHRLTRLWGEVPDDTMQSLDTVYMNGPFEGLEDAVLWGVGARLHQEPTDHPSEKKLEYAIMSWYWSGQDAKFTARLCGNAIWDQEGRVVGFFRYAFVVGPYQGSSAAVHADVLVKAGYKLA